MTAWKLAPSEQYVKDQAWYAKKHPRELEAVANNLVRYLAQLNHAKNALCVQAGYIHPEGKGVVALDQKGGGTSLQETRLYVYAEDTTKTLHIITIGNKNEQSSDIKLAHSYLETLKTLR
jgi:UDP-N-acetyl-D-mannosaminuronic acid transferase (WecB/TagA/CpsF family)